MKYALLALALCFSGLYAVVKLHQWRMTPEERAAEDQSYAIAQEKARAAENEKLDAQRRQNARVRDARPGFIEEITQVEGVQSLAISSAGDVLTVRFAPAAHVGKDDVRVLCEGLAAKWAQRAGLDYVRCESWYGNELYAKGVFSR